ncbi:MAG: matrixin family metalloprotease [Chloroflexi bacterium]|nr:matrixin family metalloprotease [Chloroflexota bacterium]
MKLLLVPALALLLIGGALGVRPATSSQAAGRVESLELSVERPGGATLELHFEIRADSVADAQSAAMAAVRQLAPGAAIAPLREQRDGVATAQFAIWPWTWDDAEIPVKVAYNPAGVPAAVGGDPLTPALAAWTNVPTSRFAYAPATTTAAAPSLQDGVTDGQSVIGWVNLGCDKGCVLGVTSKIPAAHEVDIVLNSNPQANLGDGRNGTVDTQSILLHEAGHMAGLEHSCQAIVGPCTELEANAVMYYRYLGTKRALQADDVAGISSLYPETPRQGPLTPLEPAPQSVRVEVRAGWNLIVLPAGPIDATMKSLPCVQAVFSLSDAGWDAWVRGAPSSLNTLATADAGRAYWLSSAATCSTVFD